KIVALIGANGAGKTTLLRTVSGLVPSRRGCIRFHGAPIERVRPDRIVGRGIAHVPEGRQVLARMTVLENLRAGAYARRDREVEDDLASMLERFPVLQERQRRSEERRVGNAGSSGQAGCEDTDGGG